MNLRVDNLHDHASPIGPSIASFRNPAGRRRLDRASLVPVAQGVSAVVFDECPPPDGVPTHRRLTATLDGGALEKPFLTSRLDRADGGTRHVLLLRFSASDLSRRRIALNLDGIRVAEIDPEWLQSPVSDMLALIDGLSDGGRRRLLHLMMTTGASLFGLSLESGYGPITRQLMVMLDCEYHALASICPFGTKGYLLTYRLGRDEPCSEITSLLLETQDQTVRLKGFCSLLEEGGPNRLLHVFCPVAIPSGAALMADAGSPMMLMGPASAAEAQPLVPWLARRPSATQAWVHDLLNERAETDPLAGALLREFCAIDVHLPELEVLHLSASPRGVLHGFLLSDPLDLARSIRIEIGETVRELPVSADELVGYLPWPKRNGVKCRVKVVYHSGRSHTAFEGDLPNFDGSAPEALASCDHGAAALALARARLDGVSAGARGRVRVERFGASVERVRLSLIVPVSENPDIARARAAAIASQKAAAQIEVVTYALEGPALAATRRRLAEAHTVFGIASRLVALGGTWTAAGALRAAIAQAEGEMCLLLGPDVLPDGPEWLAGWMRAVRTRGPQVMGGTLIGTERSILDAGARLDRRTGLQPRLKGLPVANLPSAASAETCLVTAECVALGPDARASLLSSPCVHPNPDILLAETVRRIVCSGGIARTSFRNLCVRYGGPADSDPLSLAADRIAACAVAAGHAVKGESQ